MSPLNPAAAEWKPSSSVWAAAPKAISQQDSHFSITKGFNPHVSATQAAPVPTAKQQVGEAFPALGSTVNTKGGNQINSAPIAKSWKVIASNGSKAGKVTTVEAASSTVSPGAAAVHPAPLWPSPGESTNINTNVSHNVQPPLKARSSHPARQISSGPVAADRSQNQLHPAPKVIKNNGPVSAFASDPPSANVSTTQGSLKNGLNGTAQQAVSAALAATAPRPTAQASPSTASTSTAVPVGPISTPFNLSIPTNASPAPVRTNRPMRQASPLSAALTAATAAAQAALSGSLSQVPHAGGPPKFLQPTNFIGIGPPGTPSPSGAGGSTPGSGAAATPSQPIAIRSRGSRVQLTMEDVMEAEEDEERARRVEQRRKAAAGGAPVAVVVGSGAAAGGVKQGGDECMTFEEAFETHSRSSSITSRPSLAPSESISAHASTELPASATAPATAAAGLAGQPATSAPTLGGADTDAGTATTSESGPSGTTTESGAVSSDAARSLREAQEEMDEDGPVTCPPLEGVEEASQRAEVVAAAAHVPPFVVPSGKVGPQDFELLRVVGQGAFGKVFQVMHKATRTIYAMKVMRKERILQRDHSEYVRSERDLLTAVVHPYIVTLRFSFQSPTKLYLVLDFLNGGHLFFNLYRQGVFSEDVARLYTAEIVLAISYLHSRGIVHRDLKPENVLLDSDGHVRLTDFGLAKGNMGSEADRTNSFIGTMEYMAPEIIEAKGHGKAVDWWSTGILMYEMLCGVPPFRAKSRQALQQQIASSKIKYPKFLSSESQKLLKGLLTRDAAKRLGSGPHGSDAVKRHPFFKAINWSKLEARQIESKFKPTVTCHMDVANFDKIWTDQPVIDSPCGTPTHSSLGKFDGFTYIAPSFLNSGHVAAAVAAGLASAGASAATGAHPESAAAL